MRGVCGMFWGSCERALRINNDGQVFGKKIAARQSRPEAGGEIHTEEVGRLRIENRAVLKPCLRTAHFSYDATPTLP